MKQYVSDIELPYGDTGFAFRTRKSKRREKKKVKGEKKSELHHGNRVRGREWQSGKTFLGEVIVSLRTKEMHKNHLKIFLMGKRSNQLMDYTQKQRKENVPFFHCQINSCEIFK